MSTGFAATFVLGIVMLLQICGLAQAVTIDPYITNRNRKLLLIIALCCFIMLFRGQFSWVAEHNNDVQLRLAMSITGYSMRLFIIMCFILIIYDGKLHGFLFMGQHDRRHAGYESGKIRLISPADNISRHWSCGGFRAGPVFVYIP